jgi:hypothetical protein
MAAEAMVTTMATAAGVKRTLLANSGLRAVVRSPVIARVRQLFEFPRRCVRLAEISVASQGIA